MEKESVRTYLLSRVFDLVKADDVVWRDISAKRRSERGTKQTLARKNVHECQLGDDAGERETLRLD